MSALSHQLPCDLTERAEALPARCSLSLLRAGCLMRRLRPAKIVESLCFLAQLRFCESFSPSENVFLLAKPIRTPQRNFLFSGLSVIQQWLGRERAGASAILLTFVAAKD
jgi:hypothetical protein